MVYFLHIVVRLVHAFLTVCELALLLDAVLSWFPAVDDDSPAMRLLYSFTDPLLFPARLLVDHSDLLSSLPIDVSYILTIVVISLVNSLRPAIVL